MVDRLYGGDLYRAYQDGFDAINQELQASEIETFAEGSSILNRPTVDYMLSAAGIDTTTLDTVAGALESLYYITAAEQRFKPKFISDRVDDFRSDATALTGQEFPAATPTFRLPDEVAQDTDFLNATARVVGNLQSAGAQISQDDLFRIIEFETGGSWAPDQRAGTSSATGLIQFLEATAQGLGTSTAELAQMTRAEQMAYVQRYLEPYAGRIRNFGDLYMAIHWPAGVGQSDDFVMYREGSREYTANRGLDANGDGIVTRGETMAVVERRVGRGTGMMATPRTAAGEATLAGPVEGLLPPRIPVPVAQTSVQGMDPAGQTESPEVLEVEDPAVETTQPEGVSRPAPDAPPPAEIARSLQQIAETSGDTPTPIVEGTIDLSNRVRLQNEDGSFSTLETISISTDEGEVLIPTISPDGRRLSDEEAIRLYETTGQHLGIFRTSREADVFAQNLSDQMAALGSSGQLAPEITSSPVGTAKVSELESIPEGMQRAINNWNSLVEETKQEYLRSNQRGVANLVVEATPDNLIFAGNLDGWIEGIRDGTYDVGDLVVYDTGQGFYAVTVIRPYDVRTIRRQ
jgi:hypothetical protein